MSLTNAGAIAWSARRTRTRAEQTGLTALTYRTTHKAFLLCEPQYTVYLRYFDWLIDHVMVCSRSGIARWRCCDGRSTRSRRAPSWRSTSSASRSSTFRVLTRDQIIDRRWCVHFVYCIEYEYCVRSQSRRCTSRPNNSTRSSTRCTTRRHTSRRRSICSLPSSRTSTRKCLHTVLTLFRIYSIFVSSILWMITNSIKSYQF